MFNTANFTATDFAGIAEAIDAAIEHGNFEEFTTTGGMTVSAAVIGEVVCLTTRDAWTGSSREAQLDVDDACALVYELTARASEGAPEALVPGYLYAYAA